MISACSQLNAAARCGCVAELAVPMGRSEAGWEGTR